MAWTTPRTWAANEVVTAAIMNSHVRDNENILKTSIDNNGHLILPVFQTKTANYTILSTDDIVVCTSGSFTVTLPTAVGCTGKFFVVKNTGSGTITMGSTSSQTIDGQTASSTVLSQYDSFTFISDNANWLII